MQAIYYPNTRVDVTEGETVNIVARHDEYSLWFDVNKGDQKYVLVTDSTVYSVG